VLLNLVHLILLVASLQGRWRCQIMLWLPQTN